MPRRPMRTIKQFCTYLEERHRVPATVIDVGACYGTPELYQAFPDSYHILFEPLPEMEQHLSRVLKNYKGEYHMIALGDEVGERVMSVDPNNLASTTFIEKKDAQAIVVQVDTLDNFFQDRDIQEPVLLKTDCQGYDMHVLRGGNNFLKRVDAVICEVNMFHPAGNMELPDFGDSVVTMRDLGFAVYDIVSYQTRPFDDALGYVDLVFARENGPMRQYHRWA